MQRRRQMVFTKILLVVITVLPLIPVSAAMFGPSQVTFVAMYLACTVPSTPKAWELLALCYLILPSAIIIICNLVITYNILNFNARTNDIGTS